MALRKPITGIAVSCARAASGHAVALAITDMNSRRLMGAPSRRGLHPTTSVNKRCCASQQNWAAHVGSANNRLTQRSKQPRHSITLSARTRNDSGIVSPRAFAVLRLITSSNLVGCSIGMSATLMPRKSWTSCRIITSKKS